MVKAPAPAALPYMSQPLVSTEQQSFFIRNGESATKASGGMEV
jgi:hypothetical protein